MIEWKRVSILHLYHSIKHFNLPRWLLPSCQTIRCMLILTFYSSLYPTWSPQHPPRSQSNLRNASKQRPIVRNIFDFRSRHLVNAFRRDAWSRLPWRMRPTRSHLSFYQSSSRWPDMSLAFISLPARCPVNHSFSAVSWWKVRLLACIMSESPLYREWPCSITRVTSYSRSWLRSLLPGPHFISASFHVTRNDRCWCKQKSSSPSLWELRFPGCITLACSA